MLDRCYKADHKFFPHYGGRGIKVCQRWLDGFENFLADMGSRPTGLSLDRIDNDGHYEPGNCRWATWKQQQRNRRSNVYLQAFGARKTVVEWAEATGIKGPTILRRIKHGIRGEQALRPIIPRSERWMGMS